MDLIDDSEPSDFDENLLKKEIERIRGGSPKKTKSPIKKKKNKKKSNGNIMDLLLPYILMNAIAPETKKKKVRRNRSKSLDDIFPNKFKQNIEMKIIDVEEDDDEKPLSDEELNSEIEYSDDVVESEDLKMIMKRF